MCLMLYENIIFQLDAVIKKKKMLINNMALIAIIWIMIVILLLLLTNNIIDLKEEILSICLFLSLVFIVCEIYALNKLCIVGKDEKKLKLLTIEHKDEHKDDSINGNSK